MMAGKSRVVATQEEIFALETMAGGSDRAEADRARAILLTLRGWTSPRLAEAFGVREDTVRFWRSEFMDGGVEALETRPLPGPAPMKTQAALRVAAPLLSAPVTNRINWTLARLADAIAAQEGVTISKSQLSKALRKKGAFAIVDPATR
jgi:transposase